MPRPVVRLGLQDSAERKEMLEKGVITLRESSKHKLKFSPPVCKVVVGVGHVDEALDEVGALDEAEEHLEKTEERSNQRGDGEFGWRRKRGRWKNKRRRRRKKSERRNKSRKGGARGGQGGGGEIRRISRKI